MPIKAFAKIATPRFDGVPVVNPVSFAPFDAKSRRTEAVIEQNGQRLRVMKGAVRTIAQACELQPPEVEALEARISESALKGYRTLAVARGPETGVPAMVGLVTLYDPPRPDASQLIATLRDLGVAVKMLTGDALPVAREIAHGVGLPNIRRVADLKAAAAQTGNEAVDLLAGVDGFAEVYPEDKYIVVQHLQAAGHVTGMTGDGVNDAPALRQAEVGIAVSTATDVAKGAASVVLTEPGLTNIVALVEQGRTIYQRILTWIINKISRTILKAAFVAIAFVVTGKFVVSAFAMLLLVFMTDFAKIALATDHVRPSNQPETWKIEGLVTVSVVLGVAMVAESLFLLWFGWSRFGLATNDNALYTFSFLTLLYMAVFSIVSARERRCFWTTMPSKALVLALVAVTLTGTFLTRVGLPGLMPLPWWQTLAIFAYTMVSCLVVNDSVKVVMIKWCVGNKNQPFAKTKADSAFWSIGVEQHLERLQTSAQGISHEEAGERLKCFGANRLNKKKKTGPWRLFLSQFKSSIILILLFATGLSFFLHDKVDAAIILTIVLISGILGFWQEKGAADAVEKLLAMVQIKITVLRDNTESGVPADELVPGDIVVLKAGDIIPADCLLVAADHLFIDEAMLTGESYPVEKSPGLVAADAPLGQRSNALWMGTHVQSGEAKALVIATGQRTEFGKLSGRIKLKAPETDFERGVRRFGYLLMEVTLILVIMIFAVNVFLHKPVIDSFLFALALAVGLTPQLLPAVISINLAHGAKRMAAEKVIVKQLASIENFGSMNVLCSDKTGTLTEGKVQLKGALDANGNPSNKVSRYAYLNSFYETGFNNSIDEAIRNFRSFDVKDSSKLAEIPYDFYRKRLSMLISDSGASILITKGALTNVLAVCTHVENSDGSLTDIDEVRDRIEKSYEAFSAQGLRTLGLAYKPLPDQNGLDKDDEKDMRFLGFITLFDPPKANCAQTIEQLRQLGVTLKIITGDNRLVAETVSQQLGLSGYKILTGPEIEKMSGNALINQVAEVNVFAEVEPNQKERIIIALKKAGFVVGYMGDGINDISALHAADVGISVDSAADVAKETAQIVLLEKNLDVLVKGVKEGRITFANTLKYVFMATSANFGNMFSMAGASMLLPFLPLLPKQILLTNLLTDFPEMTIASDNVDAEMVTQPRRWDIQFIRKFMFTFGIVSSVFDYLTFGLLWWLQVPVEQFRTGWFLESVVSATLIVFVVRSQKSVFKSRPGNYLAIATFTIVAATLALPYLPFATLIGFQPLPLHVLVLLGGIVVLYIVTAEVAKRIFYRFVKI